MDLLQQETSKNAKKTSSKKKIVLLLLILCVLVFIVLLVMVTVLKDKQILVDKVFFNGQENILNGLVIKVGSGTKYISIEKAAELLGYRFFNGEYGKNEENKNKCYLQNEYEAIGFEFDTNKIYKIDVDSNIEPKYFSLTNKVAKDTAGNLLLEIEDFFKAFNIVVSISEDGRLVKIDTCENLVKSYTEEIKKDNKYTQIEQSYYNLKAIYYDMLIVSDGTNYGVISTNMQRIISPRYRTILFDEYTESFIGQSINQKYGILSKEGNVKIEFEYDGINIINYSPLLYEAKQNNKYGVLDDKGNVIINIEYDKLGYNTNNKNGSVLIIKNINNKEDGIVVCKDGKYGVASIKTGKIILDCELEKIYTKISDDDEIIYYVQIKGYEYKLEEYIKYVNTTTVNLQNN